jgi:hypothetical protein
LLTGVPTVFAVVGWLTLNPSRRADA